MYKKCTLYKLQFGVSIICLNVGITKWWQIYNVVQNEINIHHINSIWYIFTLINVYGVETVPLFNFNVFFYIDYVMVMDVISSECFLNKNRCHNECGKD